MTPAYTTTMDKAVDQIRARIDMMLMKEIPLPALILIYATIDMLGWLNRAATKESSDRHDFIAWVNTFMLPANGLSVTAEDLYAARCAVVHSHSFESSMSRAGKARIVYYTYGRADHRVLEIVTSALPATVAVKIETLTAAFDVAFAKFKAALAADQPHAQMVSDRAAQKFYAFVPTPE